MAILLCLEIKRGFRWEASKSTDTRRALFSQRVVTPREEESAKKGEYRHAMGVHGFHLKVIRVYTKSALMSIAKMLYCASAWHIPCLT